MNWREHFKATQYNKLAFIGRGAEEWIEQHNRAIETEIIEKLCNEVKEVLNGSTNSERFRRLDQLRVKYLGKE
jgi:hypothetical protein